LGSKSSCFHWVGSAHCTISEEQLLEELQPDGSIQCTTLKGSKQLTFVVEVANSQSLEKVHTKISKWLLKHYTRSALIIKLDRAAKEESMMISFELWRRIDVEPDNQNETVKSMIRGANDTIYKVKDTVFRRKPKDGKGFTFLAYQAESAGPYIVTAEIGRTMSIRTSDVDVESGSIEEAFSINLSAVAKYLWEAWEPGVRKRKWSMSEVLEEQRVPLPPEWA
jgi:hypothetical protein